MPYKTEILFLWLHCKPNQLQLIPKYNGALRFKNLPLNFVIKS